VKRITILLAALGALLLVPVAAASAANDVHIKIEGTGAGTVVGLGTEGEDGTTPLVNCSYASPGPTTGACDVEHGLFFGEFPLAQVEAQPAPGSAFAWTVEEGFGIGGGCSEEEPDPSDPACAAVDFGESGEEIKLKAVFNKAFTVEKSGGEGTVIGANSGMNCTPSQSSCSVEYTGAETLTASPAAGYAFSKWKGCTTAVGLKCEIAAVTSSTKVIAYFVPTKTLTVNKAGSGSGTAKATGISCDESCSTATSAILAGKTVKVTTAPAKSSEAGVLSGGTGSAAVCNGLSSCEFVIEANQTLTATFAATPTHTLKVNLTGPAAFKGKVAGKGTAKGLLKSAISCGTGCSTQTESFLATDTVTLTATAPTGYTFEGWSGAGCSGKGSCVVATSSNKEVSAEFK